jgi:ankyrin repeat protein
MSFSESGDAMSEDNPHELVRNAIREHDKARVAELLENSEVAEDLDSLLWIAAINDSLDIVKLLVERGARDLSNALVSAPSIEMMRYLVDAGASINSGEAPFERCECLEMPDHGSLEHVRFLLEQGAILNTRTVTSVECSALSISAKSGDLEAVKYLLEQGAVLNSTDCGVTRCQALESAAYNGHLEVVKYLVEQGAEINSTSAGITRSNAAYNALSDNHVEVARYLLEKGAIIYDDVRNDEDASDETKAFLESIPLKSHSTSGNQRFMNARSPEEIPYLAATANHLLDHEKRGNYAKWLEAKGDPRAKFLREFAAACQSLEFEDFPSTDGVSDEWLGLIGYPVFLLAALVDDEDASQTLLESARPALKMDTTPCDDDAIPVGATKIGGRPDLPPGVRWPTFGDCTSSYNSTPEGDDPCGFVGQFNCEQLSKTLVAGRIPDQGLISVFLYSDVCLAVDGLRVMYHRDVTSLERCEPPEELVEGNQIRPAQSVQFREVLDLSDKASEVLDDVEGEALENIVNDHCRHGCDLLGFFHAYNGGDEFTGTETEHFLSIQPEDNWKIHIKLPASDLKNGNFDAAQLVWIDYD